MPGDRQRLRRAITAMAAGQAGYFTAAQAVEVGYSYQAQKFHVDHGNWQRIDRALFRIPEWPVDDDDGFVRWTVWSINSVVISHESALAWHDLGDANPARLQLTAPTGYRRSDPAVEIHLTDLAPTDVEDHGTFRITTPLRAVVEVAASGVAQDLVDSAVVDLLRSSRIDVRQLRDAAAPLGATAELGIERALSSRGTS